MFVVLELKNSNILAQGQGWGWGDGGSSAPKSVLQPSLIRNDLNTINFCHLLKYLVSWTFGDTVSSQVYVTAWLVRLCCLIQITLLLCWIALPAWVVLAFRTLAILLTELPGIKPEILFHLHVGIFTHVHHHLESLFKSLILAGRLEEESCEVHGTMAGGQHAYMWRERDGAGWVWRRELWAPWKQDRVGRCIWGQGKNQGRKMPLWPRGQMGMNKSEKDGAKCFKTAAIFLWETLRKQVDENMK